MRGLPAGWASTAIGEICSLKNGRAFKPTEWTTSGLPIVRIQNLNNPNASFNYYSGDVEDRYRLKGGELLFAWSGTPGTSFGAHIWSGGEAVLNQHIFRVDFDEAKIDKRFLRFAINQKLDELIDIAHGGVGLRHVTKGKFENTAVLLPPLVEQKHVADRLDTILARVDATRVRLSRVPALLKRFRQAVLAAATNGALTKEWRGGADPEWKSICFDEACEEITVGYVGKMADAYRETGIPFLRSLNVRPFWFDSNDLRYIAPEFHKTLLKSRLRPGDVVVVRSGTPGQCCVIPEELVEANCSDLVIVRPRQELLPKFACIFINSETSQAHVRVEQVGVAQQHFNVGSMKLTPLLLPSTDEQREIIRRVESLFALADKVQAQYEHARGRLEKLTSSLLAKAFRGELVPQDPDDESTEKLLERVNALAKTVPRARMRARAAAN